MVLQSTYCASGKTGKCDYHVDAQRTVRLRYHVFDDWEFSPHVAGWKVQADQRRRDRLASPPIDARAALYGAVHRFIVEECLAARNNERRVGDSDSAAGLVPVGALRAGEAGPAAGGRGRGGRDPRPVAHDTAARPPRPGARDVLLAKRKFIDWTCSIVANNGCSSVRALRRWIGSRPHIALPGSARMRTYSILRCYGT